MTRGRKRVGRERRSNDFNVLRLYDTESNFSRYAKIRKNDRPGSENETA